MFSDNREYILLASSVLTCGLLLNLVRMSCKMVPLIRQHMQQMTLSMSLRSVGWTLPCLTVVILGASTLLSFIGIAPISPLAFLRLNELLILIVPIMAGFHTAIVFSHEDEPILELLMTYYRPFSWLIYERVGLIVLIYTMVGLIGTTIALVIRVENDALTLILQWFPPLIFLVGVGLNGTVRTHQIVFGVFITLVVWGVMVFFGNGLMLQVPFLWPLNLYPPESFLTAGEVIVNRTLIVILGLVLISVVTPNRSNLEKLLTGLSPEKMQDESK